MCDGLASFRLFCHMFCFVVRDSPNAPETRDHWYATQVSNHEMLVPFSDNLTTLMLAVVSDLSEAQRERDSKIHSLPRE